MSPFLFENKQIICACFQSSPQSIRRIFRSQSEHSCNNDPKNIDEVNIKNQLSKPKNQKKSLRKEKPGYISASQKDKQEKQQVIWQSILSEIRLKGVRKEEKFLNFELLEVGTYQPIKYDRIRHLPLTAANSQSITLGRQRLIVDNPTKQQSKQQQERYSQHLINPFYDKQYQKLIQQEFNKDMDELIRQIQTKNLQKKLSFPSKKCSQQQVPMQNSNQLKKDPQKHQRQIRKNQRQFSNSLMLDLKKLSFNKDPNQIKQFLISKKNLNGQIQSTPEIPHQNQCQKDVLQKKQKSIRGQSKESFSISTIMYKEKQAQLKKIKTKMYAKEIESEKDGNQTDSDKMSEVVGRGWGGLTEQKLELEELQEMIKKQNCHSQTMNTLESQIKNQQTKTFTEYSNSFIGPKSLRLKPMQTSTAFGGGAYDIVGMSYQNFDYLRKVKKSSNGRF